MHRKQDACGNQGGDVEQKVDRRDVARLGQSGEPAGCVERDELWHGVAKRLRLRFGAVGVPKPLLDGLRGRLS
ncbi:MAG: hypothetical protein ACRC6G_11650 [Deefgea sp.]